MRRRLIILFGAPGSGKGLLGDMLVKNTGIEKVSTGDILRQEVKNQTPLGLKIAAQVVRGELVDDEVVNPIVLAKLKESSGEILLDGYPRCFSQFEVLKDFVKHDFWIDCIYLNTPLDTIISRISQRRICADCGKTHFAKDGCCPYCGGESIIRNDDANIQNRICSYLEITEPVLREKLIFCCHSFISIDGTDISQAFASVQEAFRPF